MKRGAADAALKEAARQFVFSEENRSSIVGRGVEMARREFEEALREMALSYAKSCGWTPPARKHCNNGLQCLAGAINGASCICICPGCRP